ncbi:hypothetical protein PCIT_b0979 [Pseudoalteromonas citrea]|uniref:Uncharacterized protein n=1 Tax=Pseudoalteromonas citrea TaxID=43655 RepID=A0AAD4FQC9_9GAMM|nr:hypothetical protein PCIT_b0979 [Pseudoalteromonas citrea]
MVVSARVNWAQIYHQSFRGCWAVGLLGVFLQQFDWGLYKAEAT